MIKDRKDLFWLEGGGAYGGVEREEEGSVRGDKGEKEGIH